MLAAGLPPLAVVFWVALGQLPVVWLWDAAGGGGPITARYLWVAAGTVGLNILANAAFVSALARSPISLTVPLLSLIPAMTAAFAWPLLGERPRSEEHTSELQSQSNLVCRLLLEKK